MESMEKRPIPAALSGMVECCIERDGGQYYVYFKKDKKTYAIDPKDSLESAVDKLHAALEEYKKVNAKPLCYYPAD